MDAGSKSPVSSPNTPRWLWVILIASSIVLLLMNAWEWTQDSSRWSGFLLPGGLLLYGIASFIDSRRGAFYKAGSILAMILMLSSIVSIVGTWFGWW